MKRRTLAVLLVALPFATYWLLKAPMVDSLLARHLPEWARAAGVELSLGSADFDPWGPALRLTGVRARASDGSWEFSADSAGLRLRLLRSLGGTPHLELEAAAPQFRGTFAGGPGSKPATGERRGGGMPRVILETVRIQGGSVEVEMSDRGLGVRLPQIDVAWVRNRGTGQIRGGSVRWAGEEEQLELLSFQGERRFAAVRVEHLEVRSQHLSLAASGRVGPWRLLDLNVNAHAELRELPEAWLEAARLTRFSPVDTDISFSAQISGNTAKPKAEGTVQVGAGRFGSMVIEGATARWEGDREGISFRDLAAQTSLGSAAEVGGRLSWKKGLHLQAEGRAEGYDLRRFMVFLRRQPFPVGVRAGGTFRAEGTLSPELSLDCKADLQARDLDVTVGNPGDERTVFALPRAAVTSQLNVGKEELTFGATHVETPSVSVEIPSGRIQYKEGLWFDTRVALKSLDAVRQYLPKGLDARGQADGRFGGPYRELTFAYDVDLASAVVFGEDLGRLRAKARYDLHDLAVDKGLLEGPFGTLQVSGGVGLHHDGEYSLQVEAAIPDLPPMGRALQRWIPAVPGDLGGTVAASGGVTGVLAAPTFSGELTVEHLTGWGYTLDQVELRGEASAAKWRVDAGVVKALGGSTEVRGEGDRDRFNLLGTLSGLRLERIAAAAGKELPVTGTFAGSFGVEGAYRAPVAELNGTASTVVVAGRSLGAVTGTARYQDGAIEAKASAKSGGVTVQGKLGLEGSLPYTADIAVAQLPWSVLEGDGIPAELGATEVSGRGQMSGALGGGASTIRTSWTGEVSGLRWGDLKLESVSFRGEWGDKGLHASAGAWGDELAARLVIPSQPGAPVEGEVQAKGLRLPRLGALARLPTGQVTGHARVLASLEKLTRTEGWGRLAALSGLEGEGKVTELVTAAGGALPGWSFVVRSPGGRPEAEVTSRGVELRVTVDGRAPGSWQASGRLEGFSLSDWLPEDHPLRRLRGKVTGTFSAQGVGTRVEAGSAEGQANGASWGETLAPSDWSWTARWADGVLRGTAQEPRGLLVQAEWAPGKEFVAHVALHEVPIQGWIADPRFPADVTGVASGEGQLRIDHQGEIDGDVALAALEVQVPPVTFNNEGPIRIGYRGGVVQVERLQLVGEKVRLGASGAFQPGVSWDLQVAGTADLATVPRWVKDVRRSSGRARAELQIKGPWRSPGISGPVTVEPGATLLLQAVDLPIQDLEASAHFDANRGLLIEWIDAQVGDGRLHLEGLVGLDGLRPGKLRVLAEARNIEYESPPQVSYLADGDLLLTGTVERPEIRGDVRLKEFLYARRLNLKTLILDALKRRPREVKGVAEPGTVFVDLAVRGANNLRVENNVADLSLAVDLRARGFLPRPVLWGRVEATDGTFRFRNQEYDVLRSSVEFLGETQPVPVLDVHARTTQQQYVITVDISGPLDRYQVTMASLPPLPQNDIVALLTLGTTAEEMTGAQGVTAAEAAGVLTGGMQEEVEGGVGELLGFDQFHIDPAYSPATQTTVPRVTVGKAITRALFARYSAAMGGEAEQDLEVQYTLNPRVLLLGTWTDRGTQAQGSLGGEVRVRFSFR